MTAYGIFIRNDILTQKTKEINLEPNPGGEMHGVYFNLQKCKAIARNLVENGAYQVEIYDTKFPNRWISLNKDNDNRNWWNSSSDAPRNWTK